MKDLAVSKIDRHNQQIKKKKKKKRWKKKIWKYYIPMFSLYIILEDSRYT